MGEITDVTSTIKKLSAALNRLTKSSIIDQDKRDIKDFIFAIRNEKKKLQRNTLIAHTNTLKRTSEIFSEMGINKPLSDIDQSDFSLILMHLEDVKQFKQGYINQYIKSFKRFSFWKHKNSIPVWITKLQTTKTEGLIQPCDLPTKDEFYKFLEAARHPRDKAMIAICADGGLRIGALLSCKVGSVNLTQYGGIIYLSKDGTNKTTKAKGIPLTWSSGYLGQWLAIHPLREDSNAPLWITLKSHSGKIEALTYEGAYQMFLATEKAAGLKKHMHPHLMRHYAVTSWILDGLKETDIKHRAGWTRDSRQMFDIYGNFTDADMNNRIWEHYGLKTDDTRQVTLKKCPRCNNILKPDDKFCSQCALVLDAVASAQLEKDKSEMDMAIMKAIVLNPDILNEIEKRLSSNKD